MSQISAESLSLSPSFNITLCCVTSENSSNYKCVYLPAYYFSCKTLVLFLKFMS